MKVNLNIRPVCYENIEPIGKNAMSLCIMMPLALTYFSGFGAYFLYQEGYIKTSAVVSLGVVMGSCISCAVFCLFCRPALYK